MDDIEKALNASQYPDKLIQLQLFEIAKVEATASYGNRAAAADIIRLLSPALKLGLYMDVDVHKIENKETRNKFGFAINCEVYATPTTFRFENLNNNIFYFDETVNPKLPAHIRLDLLKKYQTIDNQFLEALCSEMVKFNFQKEELIGLFQKVGAALNQKNQFPGLKCDVLILRQMMKEFFGHSYTHYAMANRVLTIAMGPEQVREAIVSQVPYMVGRFEPADPKELQEFIIKVPFKDDSDISWMVSQNVEATEARMNTAASLIKLSYVMHKDRLKANNAKKKKVLLFDINASTPKPVYSLSRPISTFDKITSSDVRGISFKPTVK